jgi:transcriptional regulator GlxA family with amidase domain
MKIGTVAKGVKPLSIGILGFEGVSLLDLIGPFEAFALARTHAADGKDRSCYDARVIGVTGKTFASESGLVFKTDDTLLGARHVDSIIVPGGVVVRAGETNRKISEWLTTHSHRIRRIISVCTGIYPLAKSGLLDGRKITTHWRFVQDVARRFPKLRVDPISPFIKDGPFYTCGGGTAAIEMALALIEEDYGSPVALSVARELVARLRPGGDNENSVDLLQFECGPMDRLVDLPAWIGSHLSDNLSVEALANRVCLCPRHFSRLFKRFFHVTPSAFVERLRLDEARRRLILPRSSVENVARDVGFKSADSFRRAFERRHSISPLRYKRNSHGQISSAYNSSLFAA